MQRNPLTHLCAAILFSAIALVSPADAAAPKTAEAATAGFFKRLAAGDKLTVVVYGTSLTHGGAWTVAMKQWFETKDPGKVKFVNSGGPGQNSDWGLQNLKAKVLDKKPDLVLIEFSYNDAHDKFNMPLKRGAENLDKIVTTIQSENPNTCIVLQIMNDNWDAPNGNGSSSHRPDLEKFNDNYRTYAAEHGLVLLDHYKSWNKLKSDDRKKFQAYLPDGTHPTRDGSLAVTWPAVKAWLESGGAAR